MAKFIIDRSKWRCGGSGFGGNVNRRGHGVTYMLNLEGYMCCLGQVAKQLGVSDEAQRRKRNPCHVGAECLVGILITSTGSRGVEDTDLADRAIEINDDKTIGPAERERLLAEHFATHGHEIEFIGDYVTEGSAQ